MQQKLELTEGEEFTLVGPKQPGSSKILSSPLYNTLIALRDSNHLLIKSLSFKHKHTQAGGVFYISLSNPKNPSYFPDFQLLESHLTVNQHYKQDKDGLNNGLSTIHYTERYKNPNTNENIILHVYFTKQGFFKYVQAKRYEDGKREYAQELNLTSVQIMQIKENIKEPAEIVCDLLRENYTLYNKAVEAANQIELTLQLMNRRSKDTPIETRIAKARQFIAAINTINQFSYTSKDTRGEWMALSIKTILNYEELPSDDRTEKEATLQQKVEQDTACEQGSAKRAPTARRNKHKVKCVKALKQYQVIESLVQAIAEVASKLEKEPNDVSLLIKSSQLKDELTLQFLFVSSNPSGLNHEQTENLRKWQTLSNHQTNLRDVFFEHFWNGHLEVVQELYPLVNHLISASDMIELLTKLVDLKPSTDKQKEMKDVFDFLYEKSSFYQFILHSATLMLSASGSTFYYSLLMRSVFINNLFAYEILLEHGVHPNSMGLSYNGWQIPNIFVMNALSLDHDIEPYLLLAIQHGADYNAPLKPINIDERKTDRSSLNYFKKGRKNDDARILAAFNNLCDKSLLEICCEDKKYKALSLFIPQMSFQDLLETAGHLLMKNMICKRYITPGIKHDCIVVSDFDRLEEVQYNSVDFEECTNFLTILIYGKDQSDALNLIQQLIDVLRMKIHALADESPEKLSAIQKSALDETRFVTPGKNYKYDSCMLLFMLDPNPTFMTYQSLMQLYCRVANYAEKASSILNLNQVTYGIAKSLAELSCFSSGLVKTPLYDYVLRKLNITKEECEEKPSFNKHL